MRRRRKKKMKGGGELHNTDNEPYRRRTLSVGDRITVNS